MSIKSWHTRGKCGREYTSKHIRNHFARCRSQVSVLEMDGSFDKLEELIYVESHLSATSAKFYGEITQQLLKNSAFPGSNNGTGLFQTICGLKIREVYERVRALLHPVVTMDHRRAVAQAFACTDMHAVLRADRAEGGAACRVNLSCEKNREEK